MLGRVRRQAPSCFLELPLAADAPSSTGLVPRDCYVDEALEEIALGRLGGPPGVLQFLMSVEVSASSDQLEPPLVAGSHAAKLPTSRPRPTCAGAARKRSP